MADKSPRQTMSKKSGKTLKEKRREKHAGDNPAGAEKIVPPTKGRTTR